MFTQEKKNNNPNSALIVNSLSTSRFKMWPHVVVITLESEIETEERMTGASGCWGCAVS